MVHKGRDEVGPVGGSVVTTVLQRNPYISCPNVHRLTMPFGSFSNFVFRVVLLMWILAELVLRGQIGRQDSLHCTSPTAQISIIFISPMI